MAHRLVDLRIPTTGLYQALRSSPMNESDVLLQWIVIWAIVGGGVGAAIGSSKGRGGAGFLLGLVLGLIGWIIIAIMDPTPEKMAESQARLAAVQGGGPIPQPQRVANPQWGPDPFGRHHHRLFDGTTWTNMVSDSGQQSTDEPGYPVPPQPTEGWAPDPFRRYPQRYHQAGEWTRHVARDGTTYSDPASHPAPADLPPPPQ
jgi:hypothetical protein